MENIKLLLSEYHVDKASGCKFRFVDSRTERFGLHYHEYYEIFLTMDDNIIHIVNDVRQKLKKGTLVFIRPSDRHVFEYSDTTFSFVNLTFDTETAELLFAYLSEGFEYKRLTECLLPPEVILNEKECENLFKKLLSLNAIEWNDTIKLKMHMRIILFDVFVKYFSKYEENKEIQLPKWLEDALGEMRKSENFIEGMAKITELCGKTPEHISRTMKKYMNMTPTEYINDLRINYAANRLINSGSSITEICYECGFMNISWFYSCFKKRYNMSPKEFRKNYYLHT